MRWFRVTTPKVTDGRVQRKNRSAPTPSYLNTPQVRPVIDRQRPGPGYLHVLMVRDVERFIDLLPDWQELSRGLNAVVLAPGHPRRQGWHQSGVVALCAWPRELHETWNRSFFEEHREVLDRLDVVCEPCRDGEVVCKFGRNQARGFLLMHVFLHELGHHHDRMSTRSQGEPSRGEGYAERYALSYAELLWARYFDAFGW